jgi:hypothetical protein
MEVREIGGEGVRLMITICSGPCYCVALLRLTIYTAQNEVMKRIHSTEVIDGFILLPKQTPDPRGTVFYG